MTDLEVMKTLLKKLSRSSNKNFKVLMMSLETKLVNTKWTKIDLVKVCSEELLHKQTNMMEEFKNMSEKIQLDLMKI